MHSYFLFCTRKNHFPHVLWSLFAERDTFPGVLVLIYWYGITQYMKFQSTTNLKKGRVQIQNWNLQNSSCCPPALSACMVSLCLFSSAYYAFMASLVVPQLSSLIYYFSSPSTVSLYKSFFTFYLFIFFIPPFVRSIIVF